MNDQHTSELWDLVYGLLDEQDETRVKQLVTSDPDVAREYTRVKLQAELVAKAAKLEAPPVELTRPEEVAKTEPKRDVPQLTRRKRPVSSVARTANWVVGLAAVGLLCVAGYSYFQPQSTLHTQAAEARRQAIARDYVRMVVTGPATLEPHLANTYQVHTTSIDDAAVPAEIEYRLYDRRGEIFLQDVLQTNDEGRVDIPLPRGVAIDRARFEVETVGTPVRDIMKTHIRVNEPRMQTYVSTDKPLYRPGEVVYFRSVTLSRFGLQDTRDLPVVFELLGPAGNAIPNLLPAGITKRGVGNGAFQVMPGMPGGKYTIVAKSPTQAFPEQTREFFVRDYRPPRLKKELEFTRDSYSAGDEVVADFAAERTEGGAVGGGPLRIAATVDGEVAFERKDVKTNSNGTYQVKFTLPTDIEVGDATLSIVVDDGGTQETIAKTIPINLGKVDVAFYPEGGDLVAGVKSRVYFFAKDPLGKPVHVEGRIVDAKGKTVTKVTTIHEGRGWFELTGHEDEVYQLQVTQPEGVTSQPELPRVNRTADVVMQSDGVVARGTPIVVKIRSTKAGLPLVLAASCRGAAVGQVDVVTKAAEGRQADGVGLTKTSLQLPAEVAGVVRLTVYDHSQEPPRPVAERLVYRKPTQQLHVSVAEGASKYSPGDKVKLVFSARDEEDGPIPAVMGVTVVDDAVLSLADEKRASMTTQFRLASSLEHPEDLEDIEFFVGEDRESQEALDLLLGTQGWRRFVAANQIAQAGLGAAASADEAQATKQPQHAEPVAATSEVAAADAPLVYDNSTKTRREFRRAWLAANQVRQSDIRWLGTVVFYGGAAVVVSLMLLALLRLSGGVRYWLPTLTTAAACLVLGWLWMGAEVGGDGNVALRPFAVTGIQTAREVADIPADFAQNAPMFGFGLGDVDEDGDSNGVVVKAFRDRWRAGNGNERDDLLKIDVLAGMDGFDDAENRGLLRFERGWMAQQGGQQAAGMMFGGRLREAGGFRKARGGQAMGMEFGDDEFLGLDGRMNMGGGGGFGGMLAGGKYRQGRVPLTYMYQQLEAAAAGKDLESVAKLTSTIEASIEQLRFPMRQYAHVHKPPVDGAARQDFTETICWQPLLIADENGQAELEFSLSDSVTTFKVLIAGHGAGRIGTGQADVTSRIPFSLEPKMPLEVTAGDQIELPLAINNDTDSDLPVVATVTLNDVVELAGDAERKLALPAGERTRDFFPLTVVGDAGEATIEFQATAGELTDSIRKAIRVVPPGFPFSDALAGQLEGEQELTLTLPETWVPGSLKVSLTAYPSALADIRDGIDGIIREPYGCFEQASSSNYPNIWALRFMQDHDLADPEFTRRAKGFLKNGYAKLVGYECPKKGYEWFGGDPGHEALTAYGLMEFRDMSAVWDVDQEMVERTAAWLMQRRDRKGGFSRNARALDSFGGAPDDITNAYIVWALTEAGQEGIDDELVHVMELAADSEDPYLIALSACAAVNSRRPEGHELLAKLTGLQQADGHLVGTQGSITRSGGISLQVETTALAAVAWLNAALQAGDATEATWTASAHKAIQWIAANRSGGGGFGSTQATVLALKALVLNAELNKHAMSDGALIVQVGEGETGRTEFGADQVQPIRLQGIGESLQPGENKLALNLTGDNKMPFAIDIAYRTRQPDSAKDCAVRLNTKLTSEKVKAGSTVGVNVELENVTGKGQPMTTAIIGLPAGLEARQEKLEELQEAGVFDYYEQTGRELVFYWRALSPDVKADGKIAFTLDVIAEIPGKYEGPASRAYLYYTAEEKHWNEPLRIEIER